MKRIVVLTEVAGDYGTSGTSLAEVGEFESTAEAEKWLRNEGQDGVYHIYSRVRVGITVQSKAVQERTLVGGTKLLQRTRKEKAPPKEPKTKAKDKK